MQKPFSSEKKNISFFFYLFFKERSMVKRGCSLSGLGAFKQCVLNENLPRTICSAFAWSFLGPKNHWNEPEDQRDITVPSTLLRPAAITLLNSLPEEKLIPSSLMTRMRTTQTSTRSTRVPLHHRSIQGYASPLLKRVTRLAAPQL